jgi:hypothetical protein
MGVSKLSGNMRTWITSFLPSASGALPIILRSKNRPDFILWRVASSPDEQLQSNANTTYKSFENVRKMLRRTLRGLEVERCLSAPLSVVLEGVDLWPFCTLQAHQISCVCLLHIPCNCLLALVVACRGVDVQAQLLLLGNDRISRTTCRGIPTAFLRLHKSLTLEWRSWLQLCTNGMRCNALCIDIVRSRP